ncbi:nucleotidyltransferase domain-containing protein [Clostridium botulinum]|uniref:Nucleotidyltransferase domain-containing protein n=1 Tax=Clostridium botulinum TaxID=1491 RepID=A0A6B4JQY1_CLOBO|nr:nucleotidyltransferase domain-containing protein [Clostridium botulinum]EES49292.1 DNA polymerase, beta domain protein region [Clostridium botulinum E1 str. 'BoNT E Beluga']MBY6762801.1 nucleotidyltransferase domain-containing protein [Clostridium botulinum]MBY6921585.1 nucleotidyltransferase domain-containing protein [Clostridium botulinum]MCR1132751.1 nucleotidyltransferase domain-containing protein [Clostridium botulinum]NFJ59526.1 nucleotidyltransferase domain-containing protein [Clostr
MELNKAVSNIISNHNVECVGLFGSRARGDNLDNSDYDIFIIANISMEEELEIEAELEQLLDNNIDLINLKEDMDRILLKNIVNEGIVLYNKNNAFENIYNFIEKFFIENNDFLKLRERDLLD